MGPAPCGHPDDDAAFRPAGVGVSHPVVEELSISEPGEEETAREDADLCEAGGGGGIDCADELVQERESRALPQAAAADEVDESVAVEMLTRREDVRRTPHGAQVRVVYRNPRALDAPCPGPEDAFETVPD